MVAARAALADDFAANCIFLGSEFQGGKGGTKELVFCSRMPRESLITNAELDVLKAKRSVICRDSVFTWTQEKEKGNDNHIRNGDVGGIGGGIGQLKDVLEDGERNWLDAIWRRVSFRVAVVLAVPINATILGFWCSCYSAKEALVLVNIQWWGWKLVFTGR
jgi:hypothetical protein